MNEMTNHSPSGWQEYEGQVRVATNLIADADGDVTVLLTAAQCGVRSRGVMVRRRLEIETCRSVANRAAGCPAGGRTRAAFD